MQDLEGVGYNYQIRKKVLMEGGEGNFVAHFIVHDRRHFFT